MLTARGGDACGDQVVLGCRRAAFAERDVVFARAAFVAMAFERDLGRRILLQPRGLTIERSLRFRAQIGLIKAEEHAIADVDDHVFLRAGTRCALGSASAVSRRLHLR